MTDPRVCKVVTREWKPRPVSCKEQLLDECCIPIWSQGMHQKEKDRYLAFGALRSASRKCILGIIYKYEANSTLERGGEEARPFETIVNYKSLEPHTFQALLAIVTSPRCIPQGVARAGVT